MKARSARWSLLVLPILVLALSCSGSGSGTGPDETTVAAAAKSMTTAVQPTAIGKPKQCPRESAEYYIYVNLTAGTPKVKKVTPWNAEVCPDQEVFWISSDQNVPVKPVWKEMVVPAGGKTPDHVVPCPTPDAHCGGVKIPLPPGHRIRYFVEVYGNGANKPPTETIDPELEILP